MIDIHSHVLYGLDDGAPTFEDSLELIAMAAEHGTTDLVATPHANPTYPFQPDVIAKRLAQLSEAAQGVLRLYSGSDFHLTYDNIQDAIANPTKYTINHKNYLLVEFSDLLIFNNTGDIFHALLDGGMVPIITHPERNALLRQRIDSIATWVEDGVLVQVTGQSLTGSFGRKAQEFSRNLLDKDLVHFIASDAHDCQSRPPVMDKAHAWLGEHYGADLAHALCIANPKATLTGSRLPSPPRDSRESSRAKKWYQIWN